MAITKIQSESLNLADTYAFTGTVTGASTPMTPAFEASLGSNQNPSSGTNTKGTFANEIFDTDNCYDNSTNYRFTPTTAGKYYVYTLQIYDAQGVDKFGYVEAHIYKNGSSYRKSYFDQYDNYLAYAKSPYVGVVIDMNGTTDYVEAYVRWNVTSGTNQIVRNDSVFGAYRIIE
jgi:hypothetical protein